jgi:dTDP-4-dehydrorhamnose 3,5-epimerase
MRILDTSIPGCYELFPDVLQDERGFFVKTFHKDVFADHCLTTQFAEEYYTYSKQGVLRGLHFQVPPMHHVKLVYCVDGSVLDAVVDLRIGSPTFGKYATFELSRQKANIIYLPAGLAHGFYVLSSSAVLLYKVSTVYSPTHDSGILWNSAGIPWPNTNPIISKRDSGFMSLDKFKSPFDFI